MANSILDTLAAPFRALARGVGSLFASKAAKKEPAGGGPSEGERFWAELLQSVGWFGAGPGAWSQDRALQVQQFRGWVYCAVQATAEEYAGQAVQVAYRRSPKQADEARKAQKAWNYAGRRHRKKAMARLQTHEELELANHDHPLYRLLQNPNAPDTYETFWQKLVIYLRLTGNGYIWVIPNELGLPLELWVLPSHWVYPAERTQEQIDAGVLIAGYEIRPYGVRATSGVVLPAEEVIHFPAPNPIAPFDGFSALQAGANWIDTLTASDVSRFAAQKQGIWPGLILSLLPDMHDPDDHTMARLRERFRQHNQGESRAGRPLVLGPGMKVEQATRPPAEMDWIQGSDQLRDWILSLFRVPKAVLGITAEVNRASMEAASANFARWCIRPLMRLIDGVLTEKLARRFDADLVIYHEDPTPDDPKQLNEDLKTDAALGVRTPNEVRSLRGLEPYEHGGDDPLVPSSLRVLPLGTGEETADPAVAAALEAESATVADEDGGEQDPSEDGDDSSGGKKKPGKGDAGGDGASEDGGDKTVTRRIRRRGHPVVPGRNGINGGSHA